MTQLFSDVLLSFHLEGSEHFEEVHQPFPSPAPYSSTVVSGAHNTGFKLTEEYEGLRIWMHRCELCFLGCSINQDREKP